MTAFLRDPARRNVNHSASPKSRAQQQEEPVSVTIKRSPEGAVVIARGWGFVTASALMSLHDARVMARKIAGRGKVRVA